VYNKKVGDRRALVRIVAACDREGSLGVVRCSDLKFVTVDGRVLLLQDWAKKLILNEKCQA